MSNQKRQQGFSVLKNVVNRQEQQRQNEESGSRFFQGRQTNKNYQNYRASLT